MSRKHFRELASQIAAINDDTARTEACKAVIKACQNLSDTFNASKFREACGVAS